MESFKTKTSVTEKRHNILVKILKIFPKKVLEVLGVNYAENFNNGKVTPLPNTRFSQEEEDNNKKRMEEMNMVA